MTHEQELILLDRYPDLFDRDALPWSRTTGFTLQVPSGGWFPIIDALCARLSAAGSCHIREIKEKVGELRITCEGADDTMKREIEIAQQQSRITCQLCGADGQLRILPESLAATLCDRCEANLLGKLDIRQ